jgi:hypothetical protein
MDDDRLRDAVLAIAEQHLQENKENYFVMQNHTHREKT